MYGYKLSKKTIQILIQPHNYDIAIDLALVMIADMKSSLESIDKKLEVVEKKVETYFSFTDSVVQFHQQIMEVQQLMEEVTKIEAEKVFDEMSATIVIPAELLDHESVVKYEPTLLNSKC